MRPKTRNALDLAYSPSSLVEDLDAELATLAARSAAVLDAYAHEVVRDIRYGAHPDQTLHLFPPPESGAPLLVFLHGGYWIEGSKDTSCFPAPDVLRAGGGFAAVGYSLAPGASLETIVAQCRESVAWLHGHAREYGYDPRRIHVAGHSAGGHLAAMLLSTRWADRFGISGGVLAGLTLLSGVFDLEPITRTYVNEPLGLDRERARRNSPMFLDPMFLETVVRPSLIVAHAETENSEFTRQSREFAARCEAMGLACDRLEVTGRNHFDMVLDLADPATALGAAVLHQMGIDR